MPQVSGNALVLLVQLLDERIATLEKLIAQADEDDQTLMDCEADLLSCTAVENELRTADGNALKSGGNLPPYQDLIPHRAAKANG